MRTDVLIELDHLLAARRLVRLAGGIAQALAALEVLAGLQQQPLRVGPENARAAGRRIEQLHRRPRATIREELVSIEAPTAPPPCEAPPPFEQHIDARLAEHVRQRRLPA